jgi:hypothetical protein
MATSVATVELGDNNDAQRVGKFMCVVPPKVRSTACARTKTSLTELNFGRVLIVNFSPRPDRYAREDTT